MGLIGLRKFIDSSGCTQLLPVPLSEEEAHEEQLRLHEKNMRGTYDDADGDEDSYQDDDDDEPEGLSSSTTSVPVCDHVLVDMNCIVHSCFGKHDVVNKNKKELLQLVLERLRALLTQVVVPRKSLTICLDGPAPFAKLQTQRLRRRKVAFMDTSAQQMTSLAITAGSLFMVELENALAAQFRLNNGKGFLRKMCPVFLHGSTVMGEGEAKISRALAFLASAGNPQYAPYSDSNAKDVSTAPGHSVPPYNPNDTVTILGNDIDLVLTCIGATPYHNMSVVGPSSLQLINVGDILYRWLRASSATGAESSQLSPLQLPSVRVDFTYLFLLNGGDHYVGAGEIAMPLWKRYRTVRTAYPNSALVSPQMDSVDIDFLADVLDVDSYTGEADATMGMDLLQNALWSLYTVVTGVCPDYTYVPEPSSPYINNLRAAAAQCRRQNRKIRLKYVPKSEPLTPLETFVALMPTEATMPKSVVSTLRQTSQLAASKRLMSSNDAKEIAQCAKELVATAAPALTPSEQYLRQFTQPVRLNMMPKKQRLSRYEQHRMIAKSGVITVDNPIPFVSRVELPDELPFAEWQYTERTKYLQFFNPFNAKMDQKPRSHTDGNNGNMSNGSSAKPKRVYLNEVDTTGEEKAANKKLAEARTTTEHLKRFQQKGELKEPKKLQAVQRRLHRLQMAGEKRLREEVSKDDFRHKVRRSEEKGLLDELEKFLGADGDSATAKSMMTADVDNTTVTKKKKNKKKKDQKLKEHVAAGDKLPKKKGSQKLN